MNLSSRIAVMCALAVAMAGCGNKGPLVLPEKPEPVEAAPAPAVPPAAPEVPAEQNIPAEQKRDADEQAEDAIDDGAVDGDG